MRKNKLLLLLALLMTVATGAWAQSTPTEVSTFADLQTALSAGNDVKLTANIQFTSAIEISGSKKITIDGNGKKLSTTSEIRAFKVGSSATVAFKDLTFTGFVSGGGPAINNSGTIVLDGCTISNCHVNNSNGGGAIENQGTLYASNTTFSGNYSGEIGGAINNYMGNLYLSGCTFTNNYTTSSNANYGGAIGNNSSKTLVLVNCTFSGNKYGGSNGTAGDLGVFNPPGTYTIAGCTGIAIDGALTTYQYGTATLDYSDLSAISFTYDQSDTPIALPAVPKHLITATYDKQTRSLEQPLPYETTVGALFEAVTGQSISDLLTIMSAFEMPLTEISSTKTDVVSIGEFNGASTPVTVKADGKATIGLNFSGFVQGIFVTVTPPLYVTMKDGVKDADKWTAKVGDGQAQALPIGGLKGDGSETVTLQYNGRLKVKGVKATSDAAPAANPNAYMKWDNTKKELVEAEIPATATTVTNADTNVEWAAGTYVVEGDVTINGNITLGGNIDLIIKDGAKLTVNGRIHGSSSKYNLSIYGQANQSGQLVVNNPSNDAIVSITTLEVHSCQVTATSPYTSRGGFYGIVTFNVYGGSVDGENTGTQGYGIYMSSNGSMNIYGGDVKAVGKGAHSNYSNGIAGSSSITVTVYGGKLWAEGADKAALKPAFTLAKGAGFTGKIETSDDGSSWTEYTEATTPDTKYVRVGY